MTEKYLRLRDVLESGKFAITAEIPAPVSASSNEMEEKVKILKGSVHAINVTDNPGATAHMSSLAGSAIVRNQGIDKLRPFQTIVLLISPPLLIVYIIMGIGLIKNLILKK